MAAKRKSKKYSVRYVVDLGLTARDISKAGAAVEFKIRSKKSGVIGTIQIGQGAFRWKGSHGKRYERLNWQRFFDKLERRH